MDSNLLQHNKITKDEIDAFLMGKDPMEHIIKIEGKYSSKVISIIYRGKDGKLKLLNEDFFPFVWTTMENSRRLFGGNRELLKRKMTDYGIRCKGLRIEDNEGKIHPRMENGYRILFYATLSMSYSYFLKFFEEAGYPVYEEEDDEEHAKVEKQKSYICVSPVEQHMIRTGKRLFKGYDDYDDLLRLQWDLETEGLNPKNNAISQIGIRTNKGFEKIIVVEGEGKEKRKNEIIAIDIFFQTIRKLQPDVISGHNSENFDWNFIDQRLALAGLKMKDFTKELFYGEGVYKKKKDRVLKLGGEVEYYKPTIMWGHNLTDSLFAVRRAQALDSDMKRADLKYVTQYSKIAKKNRVYVPGKIINDVWSDLEKHYAFDDDNGKWFKIVDEMFEETTHDKNNDFVPRYEMVDGELVDNKEDERFQIVSGRYIVERYLLDDLWETDKVELRYNLSNFLVAKLLPVSFEKVCTGGTATIWRMLLMAWSYEHDLAIPQFIESRSFTGGLSRLLSVGYVNDIVKLDYNSLYPSIILSENLLSSVDIMGVMNAMLSYFLEQREHYKGLKEQASVRIGQIRNLLAEETNPDKQEELRLELQKQESAKSLNDKLQLPLKITANAYFGSLGSGGPFPWSDMECAEETCCIGRQMLRLLISHFTNLGYKPLVGDSFTGDTPIFVKDKRTSLVNILPIGELIEEKNVERDDLGREYDRSAKDYWVYSRNGWQDVRYIYRHETDKDIYRVSDGGMVVDVTQDHSLYDNGQKEIKPLEIGEETKLEYCDASQGLYNNKVELDEYFIANTLALLENGLLLRIPVMLLNADKNSKMRFLEHIDRSKLTLEHYESNKTLLAGVFYLINCVEKG